MELEQIILMLAVSIPLTVLASYFVLKKTQLKRTLSKSNEGAIIDHYNVLMNINEDQKHTLNSQRMKITMLQKKMNELEGYEEEETQDQAIELMIKPIADQFKIPPEQIALLLESDMAKKFIKKNKGMIESVLPLLAKNLAARNKQGANEQGSVPETTA